MIGKYTHLYFILIELVPNFVFFFISPFTIEHANAIHQPNSTATFHKHIFSYLKKRGIVFSAKNDFNCVGGFQAFYVKLFELASKVRLDFGNKPQQAAVDPEAELKIRQSNKYQPFVNHTDCLYLLIRAVMKIGCLRGSTEVSNLFYFIIINSFTHLYHYFLFHKPSELRREDFHTGTEKVGRFKGRRYIEIIPDTKNTKTCKLSLSNPTLESDHELHRYHEDTEDPFDLVKLFHHYNEKCLPAPDTNIDIGFGNRFFRRVAPQYVLKARKKKGIYFTAGLHKNQLVGKNSFTTIVRKIASDCGLDNPRRQTAASLRSEHIFTLVNADRSIDSTTIMGSSRHKSEAAHRQYKRKSQEQLDRKTEAFHQEKRRKKVSYFFHF